MNSAHLAPHCVGSFDPQEFVFDDESAFRRDYERFAEGRKIFIFLKILYISSIISLYIYEPTEGSGLYAPTCAAQAPWLVNREVNRE